MAGARELSVSTTVVSRGNSQEQCREPALPPFFCELWRHCLPLRRSNKRVFIIGPKQAHEGGPQQAMSVD